MINKQTIKNKEIIKGIKSLMTNPKLLSEFLSMTKLGNNIFVAQELINSPNNAHMWVAYQLFVNNFQELFLFLSEYYFKGKSELKPSTAEIAKWKRTISDSKEQLDYMRILRNYSSHYLENNFYKKIEKIKRNYKEEDGFIESIKKGIYIIIFNDNKYDVKEKMISFILFIDSIFGAYSEYVLKLIAGIGVLSMETDEQVNNAINDIANTFSILKDKLSDVISNFDVMYDEVVKVFNESLKKGFDISIIDK